MARELTIAGQRIADDTPAFVIAEVGHNHGGSLETCKALFKAAADAGASAVKLQKRDNRSLFTRSLYDQPYVNDNSYGKTYGQHREALEFGECEYRELQTYAESLGVIFFATAFDQPSADFLAALDVPAFKIASGDLTNTPLLRHVAALGKPMIISTGGATLDDIDRAIKAVLPINQQLALLQCTCEYPAEWSHLDLRVIEAYRQRYPWMVIGYSGHDNGIAMPVAAYTLGARIIEKHFTLNRTMRGTDHKFSLEPQGLRKMVRDLGRTHKALGNGLKKVYDSERAAWTKMSKSIYAARDLKAGTVLTAADLALKSPGGGLAPYSLNELIGTTLRWDLKKDELI